MNTVELARDSALYFDGNSSYIALSSMALEHISSYVPEEIQFDFKTGQPNGLLMYQSMYGGANRETFPDEHDFFAFTMQQGRLVFE